MRALRATLLACCGFVMASPALADIERVKGLQCTGSGLSLTIILNHDKETADVSNAAGGRAAYRYEQDDAFLTWRLVDSDGRKAYVLREGDKVNGDLGWYIAALPPGTDPNTETLLGTCSPID